MSGETSTLCTHPLIADPWEHKLKGRAKWINSLTGLGTSQLLPWQICLVFGFFCPHLSLWRFPPFCSFSPVVQAQAWEPGALWFSEIPQNIIESLIYSGQNRLAWSSCVTLRGTVLPLSCAWLGGLCCCQCSWLKMGCCFFSFIKQYCWSPTKTNVLWKWRGAGKESKEASMLLVSRESD